MAHHSIKMHFPVSAFEIGEKISHGSWELSLDHGNVWVGRGDPLSLWVNRKQVLVWCYT